MGKRTAVLTMTQVADILVKHIEKNKDAFGLPIQTAKCVALNWYLVGDDANENTVKVTFDFGDVDKKASE